MFGKNEPRNVVSPPVLSAEKVIRELDLTVDQAQLLTESAVATVAVEVYRQLRALDDSTGRASGSCSIIGNCSGGPGCDIIGNCSSSKLVGMIQLSDPSEV